MIHFVIPTIPPRAELLERALASIAAQTVVVAQVHVEVDEHGRGAAGTRNIALRRCLEYVTADSWVGFLDDDDELLPHHCETLLKAAADQHASCAFGWFEVVGGIDPFPGHRFLPFDPEAPRCVPITWMARAEVLAEAFNATGGFIEAQANTGWWSQDSLLLCEVVRRGGAAVIPDITWRWFHNSGNTSGKPWKRKRGRK